jgi:hypothetical protein
MKKLREYKTFGCHFTLYDEGIELHSMSANRFIKKSDISDITIKKFSSAVSFRISSTKELVTLLFSTKDIKSKEFILVGEYLQGKSKDEVFDTPDISNTETQQSIKSEEVEQIEKMSIGSVIVGLIAIAIIVSVGISIFSEISTSPSPSQAPESKVEDYSDFGSEAYIVSKRYIEAILKSPSTADFPFMDFTATHLGNGRYRVTSYVDSENSFGAMIRSDWTVLMAYKSGDSINPSSWELEEVVFDGEVMYP